MNHHKINIIIIGAYNYGKPLNIDTINNPIKWNNQLQASFRDMKDVMQTLKSFDYDVEMKCIDFMYSSTKSVDDIHFINQTFTIGDTQYLCKNSHNIIIEFANLLDEYYVTKNGTSHCDCLKLYNDYKITFVSCGCGWDKGFVKDLIYLLVENCIYSPTDCYDENSYISAIYFNKVYKESVYKPYCQGLYQLLGSVMWRGCKDNEYQYEDILLKLLKKIDINIFEENIKSDLQRFIDKEIHWNNLNRQTRLFMTKHIYGENISV